METHGRPPRKPGWDYSLAGVYFVTLVVREWRPWFRADANPAGSLTPVGAIVADAWARLPRQFPRVQLDSIIIMPEHIHAIIVLRPDIASSAPLGEVVRYWKGYSRTVIKRHSPHFSWMTGFYDRIVRSQQALVQVRRYIRQNPANYKGPWNTLPAEPRSE